MKKIIIACFMLAICVCLAEDGDSARMCPAPKRNDGDQAQAGTPQSLDPNEMVGPAGVGEQRFVKPGEWMDYTIYFENATNAQAAAQDIYVTLPKDAGLDWGSFELGEVVFGDNIDTALSGKPSGTSLYSLPGTGWSVQTVVTHTDESVEWHLRVIDPTTVDNYPADAYAGFLPPNDETGCGEGHLRYRVKVKDDAVAGSVINATATIHFDPLNGNDPIETNPSWTNTVAQVASVKVNGEVEGDAAGLDLIVGMPYGELPTPKARTGYTFGGWYTGPNGTGRRVRAQDPVQAGDSGLYAHWLAHAYMVHFEPNGGEGTMSDQAFEFDTVAELDANAFRLDGHAFAGWATNETAEALFADEAVVSNLTAVSGGVVDLYATWTANVYTVTFNANGGTGGWSRKMAYGTAITAPTVTRAGYTFTGWTPSVAATVPAGNVTFTAQWEVNQYTVTLDLGGGTGDMGATVAHGTLVGAIKHPTRFGYAFGGWWTAAEGGTRVSDDTVVTGNLSLYAHWIANVYTVTFNANGGTGGWSRKMAYGTAITAPTVTRTGYSFTGWTPSVAATVPANDVAYTAQWKLNQYSVTLDLGGGTGDAGATVAYGTLVGRIPLPTKVGYAFGGWWTAAEGGTRVPDDTVVTGNLSLYAHWLANAYKVRFNANGGTGTMADQTFAYGTAQKLAVNTFTRKMYAFAGWARTADGDVAYADEQPVQNLATAANGVVTLYAVWEKTLNLLWSSGAEDAVPTTAACVYDGYLYDAGSGVVTGTIQVKVGKPNKKTGLAAVSATVVGLDGRKKKLKAADKGKAEIRPDGPTTILLVGGDACAVTLGADGLSGTYGAYAIDGARNFFSSKDKAELAAANAVLAPWLGAVNIFWDGGSASVTMAKKGKAKATVLLANGTKATVSTQLLVGEDWLCVPVVATKKMSLAFTLWLPTGGGAAVVEGLSDDLVVGRPSALKSDAKFWIDAEEFSARWGQRALPYLPDGVSVVQNGTRWTVADGAKAGKVVYKRGTTEVDESKLGGNTSALKLTYKAKDGSFKGTFKVYADVKGRLKATTVNVTGFVIDGRGVGTATVKKVVSVPVTIE